MFDSFSFIVAENFVVTKDKWNKRVNHKKHVVGSIIIVQKNKTIVLAL